MSASRRREDCDYVSRQMNYDQNATDLGLGEALDALLVEAGIADNDEDDEAKQRSSLVVAAAEQREEEEEEEQRAENDMRRQKLFSSPSSSSSATGEELAAVAKHRELQVMALQAEVERLEGGGGGTESRARTGQLQAEILELKREVEGALEALSEREAAEAKRERENAARVNDLERRLQASRLDGDRRLEAAAATIKTLRENEMRLEADLAAWRAQRHDATVQRRSPFVVDEAAENDDDRDGRPLAIDSYLQAAAATTTTSHEKDDGEDNSARKNKKKMTRRLRDAEDALRALSEEKKRDAAASAAETKRLKLRLESAEEVRLEYEEQVEALRRKVEILQTAADERNHLREAAAKATLRMLKDSPNAKDSVEDEEDQRRDADVAAATARAAAVCAAESTRAANDARQVCEARIVEMRAQHQDQVGEIERQLAEYKESVEEVRATNDERMRDVLEGRESEIARLTTENEELRRELQAEKKSAHAVRERRVEEADEAERSLSTSALSLAAKAEREDEVAAARAETEARVTEMYRKKQEESRSTAVRDEDDAEDASAQKVFVLNEAAVQEQRAKIEERCRTELEAALAEAEEIRVKSAKELEDRHRKELEDALAGADDVHAKTIEELGARQREELEAALARADETHKRATEELEESRRQELDAALRRADEAHTMALEELEKKHRNEIETALTDARVAKNETAEAIQARHQQEIEAVRKETEARLVEQIGAQHERDLVVVRDTLAAESTRRHEGAMQDAARKHELELESMRVEIEAEYQLKSEDLAKRYEREMAAVRERAVAEATELLGGKAAQEVATAKAQAVESIDVALRDIDRRREEELAKSAAEHAKLRESELAELNERHRRELAAVKKAAEDRASLARVVDKDDAREQQLKDREREMEQTITELRSTHETEMAALTARLSAAREESARRAVEIESLRAESTLAPRRSDDELRNASRSMRIGFGFEARFAAATAAVAASRLVEKARDEEIRSTLAARLDEAKRAAQDRASDVAARIEEVEARAALGARLEAALEAAEARANEAEAKADAARDASAAAIDRVERIVAKLAAGAYSRHSPSNNSSALFELISELRNRASSSSKKRERTASNTLTTVEHVLKFVEAAANASKRADESRSVELDVERRARAEADKAVERCGIALARVEHKMRLVKGDLDLIVTTTADPDAKRLLEKTSLFLSNTEHSDILSRSGQPPDCSRCEFWRLKAEEASRSRDRAVVDRDQAKRDTIAALARRDRAHARALDDLRTKADVWLEQIRDEWHRSTKAALDRQRLSIDGKHFATRRYSLRVFQDEDDDYDDPRQNRRRHVHREYQQQRQQHDQRRIESMPDHRDLDDLFRRSQLDADGTTLPDPSMDEEHRQQKKMFGARDRISASKGDSSMLAFSPVSAGPGE